ncbi:MAG: fibronectin type III domain-containing protein [Actinobacteria bacterium]|nr:fibronectin type III domain-containing protein [Actinomycetota bacterium]
MEENTGLLTALRSGDCLIEARVEASGNYLAASAKKTLRVLPASPDSPANLNLDLSDKSVEISWEAPENDGGTAISGYLVTLKAEEITKTCSAGPNQLSCVINGLTPGVSYTALAVTISDSGRLQSLPIASSITVPAEESQGKDSVNENEANSGLIALGLIVIILATGGSFALLKSKRKH